MYLKITLLINLIQVPKIENENQRFNGVKKYKKNPKYTIA